MTINNASFELGPLQKMWLESLEKHPERQGRKVLGEGNSTHYKACCLGELLICEARLQGKPLPFSEDNVLYDGNSFYLYDSYKRLGLRSKEGALKEHAGFFFRGGKEICLHSLARMNDHGYTWPEIAAYIRANPENVFTKPV